MYSIVGFPLCYAFIYWILETNPILNFPMKLNRNILSGFHCYSNVLLSFFYFLNIISLKIYLINSLAYFILDCGWIWYNYKINKIFEKWFLIHHLITIYFLIEIWQKNSINNNFYVFLICLGEFSNIFNYPIYHLIHRKSYWTQIAIIDNNTNIINNYNKKLQKLKLWQLIINLIIRVIIFTYIILFYRHLMNNLFLLGLLGIIYILGIYWFINQLIIYLKN